MTLLALALGIGLGVLAVPRAVADESAEARAPVSPERAAEVARLEAIPATHIPLKNATLASVIRLLAESAGMSYLAPPDADFSERVSSDVTMNPYRLLQVLGENYNFGFDYDDGLWRFYRINFNQLVTKAYTLRFNDPDQVTISTSSINGQLATASANGAGGAGSGAAASSKGAFSTKTGLIIDNIKKILSIPTVGLETPSLDGSPAVPGELAAARPQEAPKVDPIWDPDTNQLFVVATRQQHSLIAAYLKTVDQPQRLIRIAVKFVETSRNPTEALGVDWSNTFLGSGGPITLSGPSVTSQTSTVAGQASSNGTTVTVTQGSSPSSSSTSTNSSSSSGSSSNTSSTSTTTSNPLNLIEPRLPVTLLSAPAMQWTVQAIQSDQDSAIVQDPVIVTTNNRPVSFNATTQEPVLQGTTTIGSATAATSSTVAYIDVGTQLDVLPTILPGAGRNHELVQLNLAINVSSITGSQTLNGNPYPITSSRTYNYTVDIPDGDTIAIAGLEQRSRTTTSDKVPIFGDIPIIGYAFKNNSNSLVHTTLIAFITPELVGTDGASEATAYAAPLPAIRHRIFQGSKTETLADVDRSLAAFPDDIAAAAACADAANRNRVLNRLDLFRVELELIDVRLTELGIETDKKMDREETWVEQDKARLEAARARVVRIDAGPGQGG